MEPAYVALALGHPEQHLGLARREAEDGLQRSGGGEVGREGSGVVVLDAAASEASFHGVYFAPYQRHVIFFRELSDGAIGIFSILHENMDLPHRLREDLDMKD